jgi:hypothetical protein
MSELRNWKRIRERLELKLPVRITCRETTDFEWVAITRLTDVTPFGAGFTLTRPTEKGRLLHMTIPMPRQLRVFDHVEDQYRVWALVRYLRASVHKTEKTALFTVGVAFIGKRPPRSFEEDPTRRFEIAGSAAESLVAIEEVDLVVKREPGRDLRAHTRHIIPVDMLLEILDEKGQVAASESTVTENISLKGATLFTTMSIPVGRFIRLTSNQYQLTVHAAVRSVSTGADNIPRIHVEFIDKEWPLQ